MSRVAYQIRVVGAVPDRFFEDFTCVRVVVAPGVTALRADLTDQAELNGLLDALRRAGLELLEVHREQFADFPDELRRPGRPNGPAAD
jgi:hypothetical protein